jgi:NADH dehydrogenase [ubiquinone] 1 alpha subcomplex assembly factor 7
VTALDAHLRRLIALKGPLSLAEFMTEALWHPDAGYYARSAVLGAAGDYVTAPELSQMFGELIGLWCAAAWEAMGKPRPFHLVELGPGRGLLMADALRAARVMPGFLEAAGIHLVEASPRLREAQRARLAGQAISWHGDLGGVPEGPTVLIANEFLDALPIIQLERTAAGWRERLVDYHAESGKFRFILAAWPTPSERLLSPEQAAAPVGSVAELAPAAIGLVGAIARRMVAHGGAALLIDYGTAESRCSATLQALRRHQRHDALEEPGTADLTAHVDFAAIARAAREAGATVHGPIPQGSFLERLGIRERARRLAASGTPEQAAAMEATLRRLIEPAEMGTLFKALALTHPRMPVPAGFEETR